MSDETKKKKKLVIDDKVWLLLSLCAAFLVWYLLSIGKTTGRSFPFADKVVPSVKTMIDRGAFWKDIGSSMLCVVAGIYHITANCIFDGMVSTSTENY